MQSNIKVGNRVAWRIAGFLRDGVGTRLTPIGFANCLVVELREGPGGVPVAQIRLNDGRVVDALLSDLHANDNDNKIPATLCCQFARRLPLWCNGVNAVITTSSRRLPMMVAGGL